VKKAAHKTKGRASLTRAREFLKIIQSDGMAALQTKSGPIRAGSYRCRKVSTLTPLKKEDRGMFLEDRLLNRLSH